nr:immunoglobulin heavy chain junction region [Mus musculus]
CVRNYGSSYGGYFDYW